MNSYLEDWIDTKDERYKNKDHYKVQLTSYI